MIITVVVVPHAVLQHSVPLLLLLLRHHTEVAVASVRVPKNEGELSNTLDEGTAPHFGLDAYREEHVIDRAGAQNTQKQKKQEALELNMQNTVIK